MCVFNTHTGQDKLQSMCKVWHLHISTGRESAIYLHVVGLYMALFYPPDETLAGIEELSRIVIVGLSPDFCNAETVDVLRTKLPIIS